MSLEVASLYSVTRPMVKNHNINEICSILDEVFKKEESNVDIAVGNEYLLGGMPAGDRPIDKQIKNLLGFFKNSYNSEKLYYSPSKTLFKTFIDKASTLNEQNVRSVLKPIFDKMSTFGGSNTKYFFFSNPFKEENGNIYNALLYIDSRGYWDIIYKKEDIVESEKHFIDSATPEENNDLPKLVIKKAKIAGCICKDRENGIIERNIKNYADVIVDPNLSDPFTANSFYFMNRYFIHQPLANFAYYASGSAISEGMLAAFRYNTYLLKSIPDSSKIDELDSRIYLTPKDSIDNIISKYNSLLDQDVSTADATRAIFSAILNEGASDIIIKAFKRQVIGTGPSIFGPDTINVLKTANIVKNPNDSREKYIVEKINLDKLNKNRKRLKNVFDSIEELHTPSSKKIRYTDHYDIAENMSNKDILLEKLLSHRDLHII